VLGAAVLRRNKQLELRCGREVWPGKKGTKKKRGTKIATEANYGTSFSHINLTLKNTFKQRRRRRESKRALRGSSQSYEFRRFCFRRRTRRRTRPFARPAPLIAPDVSPGIRVRRLRRVI